MDSLKLTCNNCKTQNRFPLDQLDRVEELSSLLKAELLLKKRQLKEAQKTEPAKPAATETPFHGEVKNLPTICLNGHGPIKDWNGEMRCWTCGWPQVKKSR